MALVRIAHVVVAGALAIATAGGPSLAQAGTDSVTTPLGSLAMTIDGGAFTEECTDFPYAVVVSGATDDVQWTAEIDARRSGGGSVSSMITGFGSGDFIDDLMVCSGDGAGSWTATVDVQMRDTTDTTRVFDRTMTIDFTISKADSVATITRVNLGSTKTKVKGTVLDTTGGSETTMFGDVTVKAKKPGGSWKSPASGQVDADGNFSVTIDKTYPEGTKFKVTFAGTDEAKGTTSDVFRP